MYLRLIRSLETVEQGFQVETLNLIPLFDLKTPGAVAVAVKPGKNSSRAGSLLSSRSALVSANTGTVSS